MVISLVLVLLATASGTITTYLYDERASFASRLCTGACVGLAALGLVGFIVASFLGLTPLAIVLTAFAIALPFLILKDPQLRQALRLDLASTSQVVRHNLVHPSGPAIGNFLFYLFVAVILWKVYDRAMIELPDGIYTGLVNNFGDLPFHLSVITSFAYGNNFPPEDPTYTGVRFTYPFLSDFVSAIFVRCGADLRQSMFIENLVLGVAFVGTLHRWAWELLKDRLAAIITPLLVILNGGFGWILIWFNAREKGLSLWESLRAMPPSVTVIPETAWRWGNAVSTLLVPQRGMLMGLPLAVIVFTYWWVATQDEAGTQGHGDAETRRHGDTGTRRHGDTGKESGKKRVDPPKKKVKKNPRAPESARHPVPVSPRHRVSASPSLRVSPFRQMIAAGVIAGLLPLIHAHSFVVVIVVAGCLALGLNARAWLAVGLALLFLIFLIGGGFPMSVITARTALFTTAIVLAAGLWFLLPSGQRNLWYAFFISAVVVGLPQVWWSTHASAVNSASFFAFEFGWDSDKETFFGFTLAGSEFLKSWPRLRIVVERLPDVAWFWFKNTGLFIPLIVIAILWNGKKRLVPRPLLYFYLPFTLCFIVPNVVKLAPWVWDNIKVLYYWWLASAPLVALLLARLWRQGTTRRIVALGLFVTVILAGTLDVGSIVLRSAKYQIFDREGIEFAEIVKRETAPRELIIHAPVHNHPVFLTGRRSLMGYPGHIWTHGLEFVERESEIRRFYGGFQDAFKVQQKYKITNAVVGPHERNFTNVNDQFFSRFQTLGAAGEYELYKIAQP